MKILRIEILFFDDFMDYETLKRAVVRSLEIISEATKKITADCKVKWNTIPRQNMAGMRDRLIHDYIGVNYSIVCDVMKNKIPNIQKEISKFLMEYYRSIVKTKYKGDFRKYVLNNKSGDG